MTMILSCPSCGTLAEVPDKAAGLKGKCASCGAVVQVPRQGEEVQKAAKCSRCGSHDLKLIRPGSKQCKCRSCGDIAEAVPPTQPERLSDATAKTAPPPPPTISTQPPPPPPPLQPPPSPNAPSPARNDDALPQVDLTTRPGVSGLFQTQPLVGTAAILTFAWAGIMVLVAMAQIGDQSPILGAWNVLVAVVYVLIGVGLLQRKAAALDWGVWSNVLNAGFSIFQIVTEQIPLLALLLILEVLIVVFLVMSRKAFPPFPKFPFQQRGAGSPMMNANAPTLSATAPPAPPQTRLQRILFTKVGGDPRTPFAKKSPLGKALMIGNFIFLAGLLTVGAWWAYDEYGHGSTKSDRGQPASVQHDRGLPSIEVKNDSPNVSIEFNDWRIEDKRKLVGTMVFDGHELGVMAFGKCNYTVKEKGTVTDSGEMNVPGGWKNREPVKASLILPKPPTSDMQVIIQFVHGNGSQYGF